MKKWENGREVEMSGDDIEELQLAQAGIAAPSIILYQNAIQVAIDDAAREKQFNDGVTMASYVASTVEPWATQAKAFVAWRDDVWQYAYSELEKVKGGVRPQPTIAEFLLELPDIVWP